MKWIKFDEQLPEEGRLILKWDRMSFYHTDGPEDEEPFHQQMVKAPLVTRFSLKELRAQEDECYSAGGYDAVSYGYYWMLIPELPEEAMQWMHDY